MKWKLDGAYLPINGRIVVISVYNSFLWSIRTTHQELQSSARDANHPHAVRRR